MRFIVVEGNSLIIIYDKATRQITPIEWRRGMWSYILTVNGKEVLRTRKKKDIIDTARHIADSTQTRG